MVFTIGSAMSRGFQKYKPSTVRPVSSWEKSTEPISEGTREFMLFWLKYN